MTQGRHCTRYTRTHALHRTAGLEVVWLLILSAVLFDPGS